MSWLVGALVTVGIVAVRGPRGRPVGPLARSPATSGTRPLRGRSARAAWRDRLRLPGARRGAARPDLATVAVEVAGRLRAGAEPAAAWRDALGIRLAPGAAPTLRDLAAVTRDRDQAAVVVAAGRLAVELGTPLAQLLEGVAQQLAADAELDGERRASLAGPRATARVLASLPLLGVGLGLAVGADPVAVLLDGSLGSAALVTGVLLLCAGQAWTRRLAASAAAAGRPS